jgi:ribosomal protein L12E/L44/L45/RPP1/RPP2
MAQALILADDGLEITADNLLALTKAANIEVEPYWPGLFAKLFAKKSIEDLISNVGAGKSLMPFHCCSSFLAVTHMCLFII